MRSPLLMAFILVVGCSGKTTSTETSDAAAPALPSEAEFLAERAAAERALFDTCCQRLYGVTVDTSGMPDFYAATVPVSHLVYDPVLAGRCLDALHRIVATCSTLGTDEKLLDVTCPGYRGALPAGSACTDDLECAAPPGGQATCMGALMPNGFPAAGPSTCVALQRGAEGDPCPFVIDQANPVTAHFCDPADGLFCGGNGACQRRGTQGQPCVSSTNLYPYACADGLSCTGTVCAAGLPLGAPCGDFSSPGCLSGICEARICVETEPAPAAGKCGIELPAPMADAGGGG